MDDFRPIIRREKRDSSREVVRIRPVARIREVEQRGIWGVLETLLRYY